MGRKLISFITLLSLLMPAFQFSSGSGPHAAGRGPVAIPGPNGASSLPQAALQAAALDSDFDGLSDAVETNGWQNELDFYVTNPNDPDTDHDGLTDGQEQLYDTDPLNDLSPGIYVEYTDDLQTSKYYAWDQHGSKFITDAQYNSVVVRRGSSFYVGGPA
ncbi:MAG: hypothetical protein ACE5H9_12245, partial [Anaerolineae bacterium]